MPTITDQPVQPIDPPNKRKLAELFARASELPEFTEQGINNCPFAPKTERPKRLDIHVEIQEVPYTSVALAGLGQQPITRTLHAIEARPPGGTYLWMVDDGTIAALNNPIHQDHVDARGLARGSTRVQVVYTVGSEWASAQTQLEVYAPRIVVPAQLDLRKVLLGATSDAVLLRVRNTGNSALHLTGITPGGTNSQDFVADQANADATVPAGGEVTIDVRFRPGERGVRNALVQIDSDDPDNPNVVTALTGECVTPKIVVTEVQPFGRTPVGRQSAEQRVRITNIGDADLHLGDLALVGSDAQHFHAPTDDINGQTLTPGQSVELTLRHDPGSRGDHRATLQILSDDPTAQVVTRVLDGTGTQPKIHVSETNPFADTALRATSGTQTVTVTNQGNSDLMIAAVRKGGHSDDFVVTNDHVNGATIPQGESRTLEVAFNPRIRGDRGATLEIDSNDPNDATVVRDLTGTGLAPKIDVSVIAPFDTLPFGQTTAAATVTVTNVGHADLHVTAVNCTGGVPHAFAITHNDVLGPTLQAGASKTLVIQAQATAVDAVQKAALAIDSDDPDEPTVTRDLEVAAYDLRNLAINPTAIRPDAENATITYDVLDPKGVVAEVRLEIVHQGTGTVLKTLTNPAPTFRTDTDNAYVWRGEVDPDPMHYAEGFATLRRAPYEVRVTISRAGAQGPIARTVQVGVAPVGELEVRVIRADGTPLRNNPSLEHTAPGNVVTNGLATATATVDGVQMARHVLKGLASGVHTVEIENVGTFLTQEAAPLSGEVWRIGPNQNGTLTARVTPGLRERVTFTVTQYTKIQLVAFEIMPTATPPSTYPGLPSEHEDARARCLVMKQAIEAAHPGTDNTADVLKVFVAPEFYYRGDRGGYDHHTIEQILPLLRETTSDARYKDWVFIFGTAIGFVQHDTGGAPSQYPLVIQNVGGTAVVSGVNCTLLHVERDPGHQESDVGVCARIPNDRQGNLRWKIDQGGNTGMIVRSQPSGGNGRYELALETATITGALNAAPAILEEPVATEILNVALVQRGGPDSVGGLRDALVDKEQISAIDFLGALYGQHALFHAPAGTGRVVNIDGVVGRVVLPVEGAMDVLSTHRNVPATGGISESNRSGLGGGSLFTMAGVNFGLEVCRDHCVSRLGAYLQGAATPGDPMPQVHVIPSWGAKIDDGAVCTVPGGLVFNVDGPHGSFAGEVPNRQEYRCPATAHAATVLNAPGVCGLGGHYGCAHHDHHGPANQDDCDFCGQRLVASYTPYDCTTAEHFSLTPNCTVCNEPTTAAHACGCGYVGAQANCPNGHGPIPNAGFCGTHNQCGDLTTVTCQRPCGAPFGAAPPGMGFCAMDNLVGPTGTLCGSCGVPFAAAGYCAVHTQYGVSGGTCAATCGQALQAVGVCTRTPHNVYASPCWACGQAATAHNRKRCIRHQHRAGAPGACDLCQRPLAAINEPLVQRWVPFGRTATTPVPDPPLGGTLYTAETETTTTVETYNVAGVQPALSITTPPGAVALAAPTGGTTTTANPAPGTTVDVWDAGTSGMANTRVTRTTVVTNNVPVVYASSGEGGTATVTKVKVKYETTLATTQAMLFAGPGSVAIYPVKNIPQAQTV